MNFSEVAYKEYRNGQIFSAFAKREKNPEFKDTLEQLAGFEARHFEFWKSIAERKDYQLKSGSLWFYLFLRSLLGLTFTIKFLENQEAEMVDDIRDYLYTHGHASKKDIETILLVEEQQELKLIKSIKEERVEFTGSIVLGLNDGIIELSGALTGFTFAFRHNATVLLAGFILGISASLSMGSSAYLQAVHERGKSPTKSALYVGFSYFTVLGILIWPFIFTTSLYIPIALMVISIFAIVAALSFYTSVVFNRKFGQSFREMLFFSIGTAIATFLIGTAARKVLHIQI